MHKTPLPLVVLISGSGSNLQAIMDAVEAGQIRGEIRAVISNRKQAYGLERARRAGIPTAVIDHRDFPDRESFDAELMREIDRHQPGLVVLAGFMRILTDGFVSHYLGRMMNIHPSLLPKYQGLNTHQRALEAGDREHGASVHFVTPELDGGPVIIQGVIPIEADDSAGTLQQRIHTVEHVIYPQAVAWFAEGRLRLEQDTEKLHFDDQTCAAPAMYYEGRLTPPC